MYHTNVVIIENGQLKIFYTISVLKIKFIYKISATEGFSNSKQQFSCNKLLPIQIVIKILNLTCKTHLTII